MKSVLITGGAGFIGTHLCEALLKAGVAVRVLDIADPRRPVRGVDYRKQDVRDRAAVASAMRDMDAVFHFAAMVSVPLCQDKPYESYEVNLLATSGLLEQVRDESQRSGKKVRVLFSGSSAVYGDSPSGTGSARSEAENLPEPRSFYGAQKLAAEQAIRLFHESTRLPVVVFRFFNVFGPGQDPSSPYSGVISLFASAIREGRDISLFGGGVQTRDFISVHDVVRACEQALKIPGDSCDGSPINLGQGQSVSIRQLAEEMMSVAGRKVRINELEARAGDILHSRADISRARIVLGWQPSVTLRQGLAELLSG